MCCSFYLREGICSFHRNQHFSLLKVMEYLFFQYRETDYKEGKKRLARLAAFLSHDELEFIENYIMYQMYYEEFSIPYRESLEEKFKKLSDSEMVKDIAYYMGEMYLFSESVKSKICDFLKDITGIEDEEEIVGYAEGEEDLFPILVKSE